MKYFEGFDFSDFWEEDAIDAVLYDCGDYTEEKQTYTEQLLQCRVPKEYQYFLRLKNGGIPAYNFYPMESLETKGIELTAFLGAGDLDHSLSGTYGSRYAIEKMGYPDIGIYFAETNMEGLFVIPYISTCEKKGMVCYVDQQNDFTIYPLAESLVTFISSLIKMEKQDENERKEMDI